MAKILKSVAWKNTLLKLFPNTQEFPAIAKYVIAKYGRILIKQSTNYHFLKTENGKVIILGIWNRNLLNKATDLKSGKLESCRTDQNWRIGEKVNNWWSTWQEVGRKEAESLARQEELLWNMKTPRAGRLLESYSSGKLDYCRD